ncbi:hypothetical protein IQ37_04040 [Chryseobacterium piperi]|uniref:DUF1294 domain-containing protein n=1 Tax=Chryseobacterium piperi TaxID=558152 RepID=A0A086BLL6_9FLAO|nr:DUF1294 domain-containing protein [Chryseobacterium piperi]ASW73265.1 DUF1294 domain-containing protein [Chryseobacterium piperi]KFF29830.1 hypothetical protein IQ37_04040 [Chryseobacterium piperi]
MCYYLFLINILTLICFGYDKFLAKNYKKRISENRLLIFSFIGGTIGAFLGIVIFRHKISKKAFLLKLGIVTRVQVILIYFFRKYF